MRETGAAIDELLVRLVPLAATFAVAPISGFPVGAAVTGRGSAPAIHLGANLEILHGSPGFSVHAEQAAVHAAWLRSETTLTRLAVSSAPCGHCRQFLQELPAAARLRVLVSGTRRATALGALFPRAFGPADLRKKARLLQLHRKRASTSGYGTGLEPVGDDPLDVEALGAASLSYAPYSGNLAGCALETDDGVVVAGRAAESAAYNPSLSAIGSALSTLVLQAGPAALERVARVALVEVPTSASQRSITEAVLAAAIPNVDFSYHVTTRT